MIKIYAPASIGNVGVGFDILGIAIKPIDKTLLGDCISIKPSKKFQLKNHGNFSKQLPVNIKENIIWKAWKYFNKKAKKKKTVKIVLEKNMPIGSGLGSSASSIVACVIALNKFYKTKLSKTKLLKIMGKLEGIISGEVHYDNVAPCYLGGLQLITNDQKNITQKLPIFTDWLWVIAWPGVTLSTSQARNILPLKYKKKTCIHNSRNLATFIHALYTKQSELAIRYMKDIIAEPYRIPLIPKFLISKKKIIELGALTCNISGSGPTLFSVCPNISIAKKVKIWLKKNYMENQTGFVHICKIDQSGARKMEKKNEII
ncbi:homoserine kinase [Buchnera aphidicola]|uniref:Homoserine kinase n=1 Tax=Buchnera aphidicola subsp. Cinara cedri (strain Cc) TaxID=372461 RepID=KHSE_BUCCC|nr:homoserine kinase [Buchnera aphidicola]Q057U7.1 RecName: Full=Homoserine kinase; Short=HK; Short=HSK [Buchnera aphidicola BCc]ABJ90602.1 homoserine kinase [Buchnera aphidicola BCc]